MAKEESKSSSVSSSSPINVENYNQLLEAFKETHEEANRLALMNNQLKGWNNCWKIKSRLWKKSWTIQKLILKLWKWFTRTLFASVILAFCKNCESLEKKVHYHLKTVDKFSKSQSNLESVLVYQKCVFGKAGLGFIQTGRIDLFQNPFQVSLKNNLLFCRNNWLKFGFTTWKKGHTVRLFKVRRFFVPKCILKWVPKVSKVPRVSKDPKAPTNIIRLKFIRRPNLVS